MRKDKAETQGNVLTEKELCGAVGGTGESGASKEFCGYAMARNIVPAILLEIKRLEETGELIGADRLRSDAEQAGKRFAGKPDSPVKYTFHCLTLIENGKETAAYAEDLTVTGI